MQNSDAVSSCCIDALRLLWILYAARPYALTTGSQVDPGQCAAVGMVMPRL
jgi:hypothetical protein